MVAVRHPKGAAMGTGASQLCDTELTDVQGGELILGKLLAPESFKGSPFCIF